MKERLVVTWYRWLRKAIKKVVYCFLRSSESSQWLNEFHIVSVSIIKTIIVR